MYIMKVNSKRVMKMLNNPARLKRTTGRARKRVTTVLLRNLSGFVLVNRIIPNGPHLT